MLNEIKSLLGISSSDTGRDALIELIIETVESRLALILGGVSTIPTEMEYIVREVSVIRYNRIGSEGLSEHSVEGETLRFEEDDFYRYRNDINNWLARQQDSTSGKLRFL